MKDSVLWTPSPERREHSQIAEFVNHINGAHDLNLPLDYPKIWEWSVLESKTFWHEVWDFFSVIGDKGSGEVVNANAMPGARFFADAKLNFAENLLRNADERPALISWDENGKRKTISRAELKAQTESLAGWLRAQGVKPGDGICAYMPNIPETIMAFLAAASVGAVFSSCSMDFGPDSVVERFGQTEPKFLFVADGYYYNGRTINRHAEVKEVVSRLPSLERIIHVPFIDAEDVPAEVVLWSDAKAGSEFDDFWRGEFNSPLLALFSSGTTGVPKCIVHGAGGVLLQHLKELGLHMDIRAGERAFYFTTCGWMMWNWLVSALSLEAAVVLYEGNPLYPSASALWTMSEAEDITLFGASAKYFDALKKAEASPKKTHELSSLRTICSTGSPLSPEGFDYIHRDIHGDAQIASISGGTDIVSCFALGNPLDSVRRGELQGRGLGMAVSVYDESGSSIIGEPGELVCESPFPSMPLGFRNDGDGSRYHAAYFDYFPGVWRHGDWATLHVHGGMQIHGRSDATLNPGGVRIGTAEIYRPAESLPEVLEALAVGQEWQEDTRIVLFVRLVEGVELDDDLRCRIREVIRSRASPRHVPSKIVGVGDMPRTRSGKITEIAVRETIHGRPVNNLGALANPESLEYFRDLEALDKD